jgi:hypothetical protein
MKIIIECEMKDRWVPHFLGMLKTMWNLGNLGGSRVVAIYSDGDGDFHPKFKIDGKDIKDVEVAAPRKLKDTVDIRTDDFYYDAG